MDLRFFKGYLNRICIRIVEFIVFIDSWAILAVCIWDGFSYRIVRIFGNYIEASSILRPLGFFVGFGFIWRLLKRFSPDRAFIDIFKNPYYYLVSIIILYLAISIPVYLQPYYSFSYGNAHDFAARNHAIYNTFRGNIMRSDIFPYCYPFRNWYYLGNNFSLITVFFAVVYKFFHNGAVLILLQTIALAIGAIAIFLIAIERLKSKWGALIISISYLFYPLIVRFPFYEFRQEYFAIPFLLFAFYYIMKDRLLVALVFLFFTAIVREVGFLAVAVMGIYIFFCKRGVRYKTTGLLVSIVSIFLLFIIIEKIIPKMCSIGFYGYGPLGGKERLLGLISNPKRLLYINEPDRVKFFINYFRFLGFIPLISPMVLMAFPFLLQNWLTDIVATTAHIWHSAFVIPFLFISLIYGVYNILRIIKENSMLLYIWLSCFVLFLGGTEFYRDILTPFFRDRLYLDPLPPIYKEFLKAETVLPNDKSFFTHFSLLPNLSNREKIFWRATVEGPEDVDMDYLFFSPTILGRDGDDRKIIEEVIKLGRYTTIYKTDNFTVMARNDLVELKTKIVSDFTKDEDATKWDIQPCDVRYRVFQKDSGLLCLVYLDGGNKEDEFIQMKRMGLDVDLKEYPFFFLDYGIEDNSIQTVEIVFGIDFNGDGIVDLYKKRVYPDREGKWEVDIYNLISKDFPNALGYKVIELELYPHKIYGVDCSRRFRGWYRFRLKKVGFRGGRVKQ